MDSKPLATQSPPAQYFQVFLRLRPSSTQSSISATRFLSTSAGQAHVYVTPPERNRRAIEKFAFTTIFDESSSQLDVFQETVLPLVQDVVSGRDGMLATLGVTGSGKTHTILGNREQKGMTQLAMDVLFASIGDRMIDAAKIDIAASDHSDAIVMDTPTFHQRINTALEGHSSKRASLANTTPRAPDVSHINVELDAKSRYAVLISMYELYNDKIFDLLDDTPLVNPSARRKPLIFRKPSTQSSWDTSKDQRKVVSGLRKVHVETFQEALNILEHGQTLRRVSPTNSNLMSSRSHAFLQLEVKRFSARGTDKGGASLHIVDLAGSERARNAQTAGDRLAEAGSINRSLMTLGQCLQLQTQTADNGKPAVAPWRQSKLTEILFSNSFSGTSGQKAAMIVTADAMGDFNATSQILRYSALAREITVPRAPSRQVSGMSDSSVASAASIVDDGEMETGKDALIARLIDQLEETESRWRESEERCLMVEQTVREEVATEMEERLEEVRREMMDAREEEDIRREGYVDEKIEIMRKSIDVYEDDVPADAAARIEELELENERLQQELFVLRRQLNNRSPTKTKKRTHPAPKPLMDMENIGL